MEAITIVNESGETARVAVFRRPAANGGIALVWKALEVAGRGSIRLPGEHYTVSLLYQLPSGYGRSKVVSFPGPPARFQVRQRQPGESPHLAVVSEDLVRDEVRVENGSDAPVQVFLYREDREIERSSFLDPGEEFSCEVRPDLYLVVVDSLHPGDELPPGAQDRAVRIRTGQTARVVGLAGGGCRIEAV
jgi:hypothetical protein